MASLPRGIFIRSIKILLSVLACLLAFPVVWALWAARGDPDIRIDQQREYLSTIEPRSAATVPNIVLVLADDLGYGDLSSHGSKAIDTPHLDALAQGGTSFLHFYSASPVCSPSRFSSLTGRYPTRGFVRSVFFPSGTFMGLLVNNLGFRRGVRGILPDEVTVAEALQAGGYATGIFGKWHLGDRSPHLPTENGFDYFFGSYYSNDMDPYAIYRNEEVAIEAPADQTTLTQEFTREVLEFIDRNAERPFFAYYASPFPHHPVHSSHRFAGRSRGGSYGDCVEELDWSVGQIRAKLAEHTLTENTLLIFTSDNGPWHQGSPGHRRGRKANSFDGGQVVPFIASWPGTIPRSTQVQIPAMNIDLFPTFLKLAGIQLPEDRVIDGTDISAMLIDPHAPSPERQLFLVRGGGFAGVRGPGGFKYVVRHRSENSAYWVANHGPFLFDLNHDPSESYDVSGRWPEVRAELSTAVDEMNQQREENPRGWRTGR